MVKTVFTALILCVIEILVIVVASPMAKSSVVLRFLPEDVREAAKDHVDPPKHKQMIAHCLLAVFLISMLVGIIYIGMDGMRIRSIMKRKLQIYGSILIHSMI